MLPLYDTHLLLAMLHRAGTPPSREVWNGDPRPALSVRASVPEDPEGHGSPLHERRPHRLLLSLLRHSHCLLVDKINSFR